MAHFYLLDKDKKPYEVSLEESLKLYEDPEMKITQQDRINDDIRVSTVFLGFNHAPLGSETPILWETMIFGGPNDQEYQERYTSYEDAVEGHKVAVQIAINSLKTEDNGNTE